MNIKLFSLSVSVSNQYLIRLLYCRINLCIFPFILWPAIHLLHFPQMQVGYAEISFLNDSEGNCLHKEQNIKWEWVRERKREWVRESIFKCIAGKLLGFCIETLTTFPSRLSIALYGMQEKNLNIWSIREQAYHQSPGMLTIIAFPCNAAPNWLL